MAIKQCKHCDEPFTQSKSPLHVYCCNRCSRLTNRPLKLQQGRRCLNCQVQLGGLKRFYCSDDCMKQWRWPPKRSSCKQCGKVFNARYDRQCCSPECKRELHFDRNQISNLRHKLKRKGITVDVYNAMLDQQDHRCAICRRNETATINGKVKRLAVDHCHESGQVRGLLCQRCNIVIGQLGDSWLTLENAQEYLVYWHSKLKSSHQNEVRETPSLN